MQNMVINISNKNHLVKIQGSQGLADAFHDLCIAASSPRTANAFGVDDVIDCKVSRLAGSFYRDVKDEKLCRQLEIFKICLMIEAESIKSFGINEGTDLLFQLNNGKLTTEDFNKKLKSLG